LNYVELLRTNMQTIDENVLRHMERKRAPQIFILLMSGKSKNMMARELEEMYCDCKKLPNTSTVQDWINVEGVSIDGSFQNFENLIYAFERGLPRILKLMNEMETRRIQLFEEKQRSSELKMPDSFVPYRLISHKSKKEMACQLMPLYKVTVSLYRGMSSEQVGALIRDVSVALDYIHSQGFAHMDVKPENIFTDDCVKFFLGDVGSITPLGASTMDSTTAYIPDDIQRRNQRRYTASPQHDFWMLAMTLYSIFNSNKVGTGGRELTCEELKNAIVNDEVFEPFREIFTQKLV